MNFEKPILRHMKTQNIFLILLMFTSFSYAQGISNKSDSIVNTLSQEFLESIKKEVKINFYQERHNIDIAGFNFKPVYDSLSKGYSFLSRPEISLRQLIDLAGYNLKVSLIAIAQMDHALFNSLFASHDGIPDTTGINYLDEEEREYAVKHPESIAAKQILVYDMLDEMKKFDIQILVQYFDKSQYPITTTLFDIADISLSVSYLGHENYLAINGYSETSRDGMNEKDQEAYNYALKSVIGQFLVELTQPYLQLR